MSFSPEGWSAKRDRELPPLPLTELEKTRCDLDKAWHALHYLLTKSQWDGDPPLNFLVSGGTPVGDVDVGYGPARVLSAEEVAVLHEVLKPVSRDYLRSRFDAKDMMEKQIYPEIWDRDAAEDDTVAYCLDYFDELKNFITSAADSKLGLTVRVC
jgi:hypothetical protein